MQLRSAGGSMGWDLSKGLIDNHQLLVNGDKYRTTSGTITYNTGANATCTNTLRGILGGTQAELTQ